MATKEELLKEVLEGPGLKPPPNVIPNLINPPTKQHINLLCQVTCLTLSSVFVLIRMYTKIYVMKNHGWEDGMLYRIIVLRHRKLTRDTVACLIAWVRKTLETQSPANWLHLISSALVRFIGLFELATATNLHFVPWSQSMECEGQIPGRME